MDFFAIVVDLGTQVRGQNEAKNAPMGTENKTSNVFERLGGVKYDLGAHWGWGGPTGAAGLGVISVTP